jgi:putative oxidoreductase
VRLATGALFVMSGWNKLTDGHRQSLMIETMREGRIPGPRKSGKFVAGVELVGGALILAGLFTPVAAAVLAVVMVVAITRVQLAYVAGDAHTSWWENFLFLPDVLYLVIFLWLMANGPGPISLDALLL